MRVPVLLAVLCAVFVVWSIRHKTKRADGPAPTAQGMAQAGGAVEKIIFGAG